MLDFVFKDEITDLQRAEILLAARMEDLKRTGQSTQRADEYDINHTNDEDDMNKARGCLSLISPDVYAEYLKAQEVLGYVWRILTLTERVKEKSELLEVRQ